MHEQYWKHIDVWVDRFGLDFYGFSSVEAAACGIPIVCQIGEKELGLVPKCPFINTTTSELVDVLVETDFLDKKLKEGASRTLPLKSTTSQKSLHCANADMTNFYESL